MQESLAASLMTILCTVLYSTSRYLVQQVLLPRLGSAAAGWELLLLLAPNSLIGPLWLWLYMRLTSSKGVEPFLNILLSGVLPLALLWVWSRVDSQYCPAVSR